MRELDGFKQELGEELFEGFSREDVAQMLRTLDRLHANLEIHPGRRCGGHQASASQVRDMSEQTKGPKPRRRWLRRILLLVVPLIAVGVGLAIYLHGGRYISTDNAYVAAQKVLVTPQMSGTVNAIKVAEGQKLKAGDVLFTVDPKPYEIGLAEARAALTRAETDFGTLKTQYQGFAPQIEVARETVALRQEEVDRKSKLLASKVVARSDIERGPGEPRTRQGQSLCPRAGPAQCAEPAWRQPGCDARDLWTMALRQGRR